MRVHFGKNVYLLSVRVHFPTLKLVFSAASLGRDACLSQTKITFHIVTNCFGALNVVTIREDYALVCILIVAEFVALSRSDNGQSPE